MHREIRVAIHCIKNNNNGTRHAEKANGLLDTTQMITS